MPTNTFEIKNDSDRRCSSHAARQSIYSAYLAILISKTQTKAETIMHAYINAKTLPESSGVKVVTPVVLYKMSDIAIQTRQAREK